MLVHDEKGPLAVSLAKIEGQICNCKQSKFLMLFLLSICNIDIYLDTLILNCLFEYNE